MAPIQGILVRVKVSDELTQLTHTFLHRVVRYFERQGLLVRDGENSYLTAECVDAIAHERDKQERVRNYSTRPAESTQRLSLTCNYQARCEPKTS